MKNLTKLHCSENSSLSNSRDGIKVIKCVRGRGGGMECFRQVKDNIQRPGKEETQMTLVPAVHKT